MSEPIRRCAQCRMPLPRTTRLQFCSEQCADDFSENYWRTFLRRRASGASSATGGRSETTGTSSLDLSGGEQPPGFSGSKR